MKNFFILICVSMTVISGCRKNAITYSDTGTLTGADFSLCPCCGGVFLEKADGTLFHIEALPDLSQQELYNLPFPKQIKYNWQSDRECGGNIYIRITAYEFY